MIHVVDDISGIVRRVQLEASHRPEYAPIPRPLGGVDAHLAEPWMKSLPDKAQPPSTRIGVEKSDAPSVSPRTRFFKTV